MIEEIVSISGIVIITILLIKIFHFMFRMKLIYLAADISREIQGIESIQKPPLKNLINMVNYLLIKREEIEKQFDKDESDDRYKNIYG